MGRTATGIDVGTSTVKVLKGESKGNTFVVTDFDVVANEGHAVGAGWGALSLGFKPERARIGLTGREVNIRYSRVPRLPDWQLRKLMRFEAEEVGGQSDAAVASDFNLLPEIPEIEGEDVVLLAMARESMLEEHMAGLARAGGSLDGFTPNSVALYNAFLHYGVVMDDVVLVANLGRENTDVVLMRGQDLLFARNLSGGSKLFDDAIVERFGVGDAKAEEFKVEKGTLDVTDASDDPNREKAARAMMAPAGQILSLLQSTVLFAKNQVKLATLKLDRVMLCGGGAALPGLVDYLKNALDVPVELFDPFRVVDTTKLDPEAADKLEEHELESVIALGLAHAASDPDAYSIELLPSAVRKRREFMQGSAFLIAAAALALLYLGAYWMTSDEKLTEAQANASQLESRSSRARRTHQNTLQLLEENEGLAAYARELASIVGGGEQIVRTLDSVERHLPPDFWLDGLTASVGFDEGLGIDRADEVPVLRVSGRAREGTQSATELFGAFVDSVSADLPQAALEPRLGATGSTFTLDLSLLAPRPDDEAEDDGEEG